MNELKVLILEDDESRCEWFREVFKGKATLHITKSPGVAERCLEREEYDYIFLDHDLAIEHYAGDTNCDVTTGLAIAKLLGERKELSPKAEIVIHSMNPNGVQRMKNALEDGGRKCQTVAYPQLRMSLTVN